ncbi:flagellar export protein FliJ [Kibdelosporangium persicum]|uniref:Integral membrane protein n=1 Tax=Kibdelosporangium persicum TaxID=2698649 RepID=A0ABX2FAL1_9PSEU|nr:flagellar export protein FliJ [Kibdelosporangium persicum]NRN68394.1 Integral membrane protein [Kibdelosporangium persicum]
MSYPAIGFNPAPGTVGSVTSVADNMSTVAKELNEAYTSLTSIGRGGSVWEGEAASGFQGKVGELPDYLDKARRSLGDASKVLQDWAADLESMQRTAQDYEAQAKKALQAVRNAENNPDLGLAGQMFDTEEALRTAQQRFDQAKQQLTNAENDLTAIREQAKRLLEQHQELADRVADALRRAKDEAPEEPGFFDRIGEALSDIVDGVKELAGDVWNFVKEHADVIAKIGTVLSAVGNVLGVVAIATCWIPGVNAVTATAAAVVSGAAAGTKLLAKAAGADVSWTSIGMDAIGVIPGGRVVAGAKNAAVQAARTTGAVSRVPVAGAKVVQIGSDTFTPITQAALRANPAEAMYNAARYTHANGVKMANWIPGVNITDAFSTGGLIAGTAVNSTIKTGIGLGKEQVKEHSPW